MPWQKSLSTRLVIKRHKIYLYINPFQKTRESLSPQYRATHGAGTVQVHVLYRFKVEPRQWLRTLSVQCTQTRVQGVKAGRTHRCKLSENPNTNTGRCLEGQCWASLPKAVRFFAGRG